MEKEFGVTSKSKFLYDAFIYELIKIGFDQYEPESFRYNDSKVLYVHREGYNWCHVFSKGTTVYDLVNKFNEAIEAAKNIIGYEATGINYNESLEANLQAIKDGLLRAKDMFPSFYSSSHEALGVIREEYIEFEQEVFKNPKKVDYCLIEKQKEECIQLAAMCLRFLIEIN